MKRLIKLTFSFLLIGFCTNSYSQTMPTVGEIYDFDINDNFIFLLESEFFSSSLKYDSAYTDIIILDKYFSTANDTVFYVREISYSKKYQSSNDTNWNFSQWTDTISYYNLDSTINYNIEDYFSYQFDTTKYNQRISLRFSDDSGYSQGYAKVDYYTIGCGHTVDSYNSYDAISSNSRRLVYFEKGLEIWGQKISLPTSIDNVQLEKKDIVIFPNPASETITIKQDHSNYSKIEILDITGKSLKTYNDNKKTINISGLHSGIYFISLSNENSKSILKFIKN